MRHSISILTILSALGASLTVYAEEIPFGLVGGIGTINYQPVGPMYAVLVSPDGTLTQLLDNSLFPNGAIPGASINPSGNGLIGGTVDVTVDAPFYAAFVTANGNVTPITGFSGNGVLKVTSINSEGVGIVGGAYLHQTQSGPPIVAIVNSSGGITMAPSSSFPGGNGEINGVAINTSGQALFGGYIYNNGPAFAGKIDTSGTVTPLQGANLPSNGIIRTVAINASGHGLIGGTDAAASNGYAARIAPDGTAIPFASSDLPSGISQSGDPASITRVAINSQGLGLMGGFGDVTDIAYLAFVTADGSVQQITDPNLPLGGGISSVALNNSGHGLIGGQYPQNLLGNNGPAFAALVSPSGAVTPLSEPSFPNISGTAFDVAMNDAGVGLIAAQDFNIPTSMGIGNGYLAIVAPDGTVTPLSLANFPRDSFIMSVSVVDASVPASIGPYWGTINTQLAAMHVLEAHLLTHVNGKTSLQETAFLVSANGTLKSIPQKQSSYDLWFSPFYEYLFQSKQGNNPSYHNQIGGGVLGFDYAFNQWLIGGGLGYAYNYLQYASTIGHGNVQEEMLFLYGSYTENYIHANIALWSGIYQFYNKRFTFSVVPSEALAHGWLFAPHAEIGVPFIFSHYTNYTFEPFAMVDWVNNWQGAFTETGSANLNLVVGDIYNSVLRSEVGMRFFQRYNCSQGLFKLEEQLSYVNMVPFNFQARTVNYVGSGSTFPIAMGTTIVQNLGSAGLQAAFVPKQERYPYLAVDFQGQCGTALQSYYVGFEIGRHF